MGSCSTLAQSFRIINSTVYVFQMFMGDEGIAGLSIGGNMDVIGETGRCRVNDVDILNIQQNRLKLHSDEPQVITGRH